VAGSLVPSSLNLRQGIPRTRVERSLSLLDTFSCQLGRSSVIAVQALGTPPWDDVCHRSRQGAVVALFAIRKRKCGFPLGPMQLLNTPNSI